MADTDGAEHAVKQEEVLVPEAGHAAIAAAAAEPDSQAAVDVVKKEAEHEEVKAEQADVKTEQELKADEAAAIEPSDMPSVDKDVVLQRLRDILPTVDFESTSEKMLRKQLETEFGTDFTHLKADIRKTIEAWMDEQPDAEEDQEEQEAAPKKKARGGFGKLQQLSPALSEFLGVESESRAQVVKKIWDYIKANNLQDPKDKRKIKPDEKLKKVFPTTVTMFSMNKVLSKHFLGAGGDDAEAGSDGEEEGRSKKKSAGKRRKRSSDDDEEDDEEDDDDDEYRAPKKAAKAAGAKRKSGGGGGGGFTALKKLSPELSALVGESEMSRPQLTKFFTGYFKENNLLDPKDKRKVLCNETLKSLFGVDTFNAFGGIQKLLSPHLS